MDTLGNRIHGTVVSVEDQRQHTRSAIKIHEHEAFYQRERDIYLRLRDWQVVQIDECQVPQLHGYDDELWVIEMSIVSRPYVLDFAGAYLDAEPEFSEEVWADWRTEKEEQFGDDWPRIQTVLRKLRRYGAS